MFAGARVLGDVIRVVIERGWGNVLECLMMKSEMSEKKRGNALLIAVEHGKREIFSALLRYGASIGWETWRL